MIFSSRSIGFLSVLASTFSPSLQMMDEVRETLESLQITDEARDIFKFWLENDSERMKKAVPPERTMESSHHPHGMDDHGHGMDGVHGRNLQDSAPFTSDATWGDRNGLVRYATGRIYADIVPMPNYYRICSATLIDDWRTPGRSMVLTAAHCVFEEVYGPDYLANIMFVPMQDDDGGDFTNLGATNCLNDKFGCWAVKTVVIDSRWAITPWPYSIPVDYAILVIPDEGYHFPGYDNNNPALDKAIKGLEVDMTNSMGLSNYYYGIQSAMYLGYPWDYDPDFRYCRSQYVYNYIDYEYYELGNIWELYDCLLDGGSSGGPAVISRDSKIFSVLSYGSPCCTGGPNLFDNSFSCVYQKGRTVPLEEGNVMINYGGTPCKKSGGVWGDPHFKTWGGEQFDFMGSCDLVLADTPAFDGGLGFAAHVRAKGRYDYSYIESAAIKIGDDILEVGAYGFYIFNGVVEGELGLMGGKYHVTRIAAETSTHTDTKDVRFHIQLEGDDVITVKAHKDIVSLLFADADSSHFKDVVGIMGDFYNGTKYSRSGEVMVDDNLYGQEWQVRPAIDPQLFQTKSNIEWPAQQCVLPDPAAKEARRLGAKSISLEAATMACSHFTDQKSLEACIHDVIATDDLGAATSGAF